MEYTVTSEDIYLHKSPNFVLVIIYTHDEDDTMRGKSRSDETNPSLLCVLPFGEMGRGARKRCSRRGIVPASVGISVTSISRRRGNRALNFMVCRK